MKTEWKEFTLETTDKVLLFDLYQASIYQTRRIHDGGFLSRLTPEYFQANRRMEMLAELLQDLGISPMLLIAAHIAVETTISKKLGGETR